MRNNSFRPATGRGGKVFRNNKFGNRRPKQQGQYIDPEKFVNKAIAPEAEVAFVPQHTFGDFAFSGELQRNIIGKGYIEPTPIQDGTIKHALAGKDVIGL